MRLAIMQPYFFPYLGYFSLIAATDKLIVFDTAQYIRHGWVNRNRILKPSKDDWQYVTAPLEKHKRETPISQIFVKTDNWENKILAQLQHYKKRAKHYNAAIALIEEVLLSEHPDNRIVHRATKCIELVCEYCNLPLEMEVFSQMNLALDEVNEPDEWALNICKSLNATGYVNPTGGLDFFDPKKYSDNGVSIQFLKNSLSEYYQPNNQFISGLSIIDALMYCEPEQIRTLIESYEFVNQEVQQPD